MRSFTVTVTESLVYRVELSGDFEQKKKSDTINFTFYKITLRCSVKTIEGEGLKHRNL